jgi:putative membrane protein
MACSFGCLSLFINGLVFWAASWVALRMGLAFRVSGFWAGVFGALVSSIVATVLESLFLGREQPPRPEAPRRIKIVS